MSQIIPKPALLETREGTFKKKECFYVNTNGFKNESDRILQQLATFSDVEPGTDSSDILIRKKSHTHSEGYVLIIEPKQIVLEAGDIIGILHGIQSLRQLFGFDGNEKELQCCKIVDSPRFIWRGVHLDVSRHFYPVSFIKRFIDIISLYKMNIFHWHLVDDQGWRLEIKKYPELHSIGSSRIEKDGSTYSGCYKQSEIREVVDYATKKGIDVVPEIEMPGHASSALAAYPKLSCKGNKIEVPNEWGVFQDVYCAGKEGVFKFLQEVLEEVIELFPYRYIHIGGDECPKSNWRECPDCQKRKSELQLENEEELQSYFVHRIVDFLKSRGKIAIGWDEILEGGLAKDAIVMSWQGYNGALEAVKKGNRAILTPTSHCYFDYYQAEQGEPEAFNALLPLEKVYEFEPIPEGLTKAEQKSILGAQANVWTEYMHSEKQVEYMLLPRLAAMAEVLWSKKKSKDYEDFLSRLKEHPALWKKEGYNYRDIV